MNSKPMVTVAIPTFNRINYLKEAIESVLTQTVQDIEILIADNASTDGTEGMVRKIADADSRIVYFRHSHNIGQIGNWNFCLEKARGEYFLMLSDDDIMEKESIARLLSGFEDPQVTLVYSKVLFIDSYSQPFGLSKAALQLEAGGDFILGSLSHGREIYPSATMHRTDTAKRVGGYPDIGTTTDLAIRLRIAQEGKVKFVNIPLVRYRIHNSALSNSGDKVASSFEQFLAWIAKEENPLYEYRRQALRFSVKYIEKLARSQSLRGNCDKLQSIVSILKKVDPSWRNEEKLKFFGLLPIRMVATSRRLMRMELAKLFYRIYDSCLLK